MAPLRSSFSSSWLRRRGSQRTAMNLWAPRMKKLRSSKKFPSRKSKERSAWRSSTANTESWSGCRTLWRTTIHSLKTAWPLRQLETTAYPRTSLPTSLRTPLLAPTACSGLTKRRGKRSWNKCYQRLCNWLESWRSNWRFWKETESAAPKPSKARFTAEA